MALDSGAKLGSQIAACFAEGIKRRLVRMDDEEPGGSLACALLAIFDVLGAGRESSQVVEPTNRIVEQLEDAMRRSFFRVTAVVR